MFYEYFIKFIILIFDLIIVKSIQVYFEDEEMNKLKESKGKLSWHNFIMQLIKEESDIKQRNRQNLLNLSV